MPTTKPSKAKLRTALSALVEAGLMPRTVYFEADGSFHFDLGGAQVAGEAPVDPADQGFEWENFA